MTGTNENYIAFFNYENYCLQESSDGHEIILEVALTPKKSFIWEGFTNVI